MPCDVRHATLAIAFALAASMLPAPAGAQDQPRRGGTLVYAVDSDPPSCDCINSTTFVAVQTLNPHCSQLLKLDALFEMQKRFTCEAERMAAIRAFEKREIEAGYVVPVVWWHRIVAHSAALRGWKILPSHYLNQDLAGVWLAAQ